MKPLTFLLCPFWFIYLQLVLLYSFNLLLQVRPIRTTSALGKETDHLALLKFKESIFHDPYDIFASWNSSTHFCNWPGIGCSHRHRQRVTSLDLSDLALRGFISPHVGNLSFLRHLNLDNNGFSGTVPQELAHLFRLEVLSLTNNTLEGDIPSNLTSCSKLRSLSLRGNRLVGQIPMEIGYLLKLQQLYLYANNLSGQFPTSLWNLSSLYDLDVGENNLEGKIPEEIGQLELQYFGIAVNQFCGMLPSSLYIMSSLIQISITENKFKDSFPSNMFLNLPNLQAFWADENQFLGMIPNSIVNASKLNEFGVEQNNLVGQVPNLGSLKDLWWLNLAFNNLGNDSSMDLEFMKSLVNCTKLSKFYMNANNFGGALPDLIGNFSQQLSEIFLENTPICGKIPETLGKLINLTGFSMEGTNI